MNGKKAKLLRKAARMVCDPTIPNLDVTRYNWGTRGAWFIRRVLNEGSFRKTYKDMKKAFKTLPHHSKGVSYAARG